MAQVLLASYVQLEDPFGHIWSETSHPIRVLSLGKNDWHSSADLLLLISRRVQLGTPSSDWTKGTVCRQSFPPSPSSIWSLLQPMKEVKSGETSKITVPQREPQ